MITPAHLTVGLNGSPNSLAALHFAVRDALRSGIGLHMVYALDWPPLSGRTGSPHPGAKQSRLRQEAEQVVADTVAAVRRIARDVPVTSAVADGSPAAALINESASATSLVVGAPRAAGFPALRLRATSVKVAMQAACPVTVVPQTLTLPDGPVVVGIDGSQAAALATRYAMREAELRHTSLVAVHAWQPTNQATPEQTMRSSKTFIRLQAEHTTILETTLTPWQQAFPHIQVAARLLTGETAAVLMEAAKSAALLVIGPPGMGAIHGTFARSVALHLLERAPCPLAIVRPHHHSQ